LNNGGNVLQITSYFNIFGLHTGFVKVDLWNCFILRRTLVYQALILLFFSVVDCQLLPTFFPVATK